MEISEYLNGFFKKGNINKGDKLILHSDITKLYKNLKKLGFNFTLDNIADHLIEYIGEKGTLIIPTFNFDFCKGKTFSIKDTPSQMGVFSETLRLKAGKNRSWHPVYSFVIFGSLPKDFLKFKDYSAYGRLSLFHWLTLNDGKISVINLPDQKSMTYYHYVEEELKVNWRKSKIFTGNYIDFENVEQNIKAEIFVRKIEEGIVTDVKEMENILWDKNLYISEMKCKHDCRSIQVRKLNKEVKNIILKNKANGILYKIDK